MEELTQSQKIIINRLCKLEVPIEKMMEILAFLQDEEISKKLAIKIEQNPTIDHQGILQELVNIIRT